MSTLEIPLPDPVRKFVEQRVATGGFSDAAAYLRALIEADQKNQEQDLSHLRSAAQAGVTQLDRGEWIEVRSGQQLLDDIVGRGEERLAKARPKTA